MTFFKNVAILATVWLFASLQITPANAQCQSAIVLDSIVPAGGNFNIYATLCIGAGTDGVTQGGSGDTQGLFFGFYTISGTMVLSNFLPPFIFGDTTIYYLNGNTYGPIGAAPFNGTHETLAFTGSGQAYTCVTNPSTCGLPHQDCTQFIFTVNEIPDSIRVFGAESGSGYTGACYPQQNLLLNFTTPQPVTWAGFEVQETDGKVELEWGTHSEENNDHFEIMRSTNGVSYFTIGTMKGAGNSNTQANYRFVDEEPAQGTNYYKVAQVDFDGNMTYTEVAHLSFNKEGDWAWTNLYPNPAENELNIAFEAMYPQSLTMEIVDLTKGVIATRIMDVGAGTHTVSTDIAGLAQGMYLVRLSGAAKTETQKFIRQ